MKPAAAAAAAARGAVHYQIHTAPNAKRIAVLTLDNGPVNGLALSLRKGIVEKLQQAQQDKVHAAVIVGAGSTFPAGADIAEFEDGSWTISPDLGAVVSTMDPAKGEQRFPITVAAIHGTALGGGLELALACNYRVAASAAKLGLPEVHLGILPGAQGTQRLPRAAGAAKALEMILSGAPVAASDALKLGLVDKVAAVKDPKDLVAEAVAFASGLSDRPRLSQAKTPAPLSDETYAEAVKKLGQRGHKSPPKIVEAVKAATLLPFDAGVNKEATIFKELMATPEASGLQHMFFAERTCTKIPGVDAKLARNISKVGIIGAGTMGAGIAMCFAAKGVNVTLCEVAQDKLDLGLSNIEGNWKRSSAYKTGKMTDAQLKERMALISTSTAPDYKDLANCDAVIEAAFESLKVKKEIFGKLDKVCKKDALLCTNTSYLDVDEIASATSRPEQVIGTHFFSPANVMPLLENVRGKRTSNEAIATAMKMGKDIGKTAVLAKNAFGFIGNRMFEPYTQQAILMLEEGATPSQVDSAMGPTGYGMAMGPLAVFDLAGNDIGQRIRGESYYPYTAAKVKGARGKSWMALADELCNQGRLGQKTGKGWFSYEDKRKAVEDPVVLAMAKAHAAKFGIAPRSVSALEVVERCMFAMVNEGFRILEEGVAVRSSDIDVVWNYGYGFPRYRGGPMHWADRVVGLPNVHKALLKHLQTQPELPEWHFKPAALLEKLVKEGKSLSEYEKRR